MPTNAPSLQLSRRALLAAGVLAVAGCGGGGGATEDPAGGGGAPSPAPTPTPTPTPSPSPSPSPTPAPSPSPTPTPAPTPSPSPTPAPSPSPTPVGNRAPVWVTVPTVTFTVGVPATFPISAFVSDADGDALTITHTGTLPVGVTFDAANKRFVYDGSGAVQSTTGHVLTANDLR